MLAVAGGCVAPADGREHLGTEGQEIVRGSTSQVDFVLALAVDYDGNGPQASCSGSLVAKNLLLTAHHCVGNLNDDLSVTPYPLSSMSVYAGNDALAKIGRHDAPAAHVKRVFAPSDSKLEPDVALVLLDRPVDGPRAAMRLRDGAKVGERMRLVGFGITETSELPAVRMERTTQVDTIGPAKTAFTSLSRGQFAMGEGACYGDSGGPAIDATTHAVVGVASSVWNGTAYDPDDVAKGCVGVETESIYTALPVAKAIIDEAFSAAGAAPWLEGQADPETTTAPPPADDFPDAGSERPNANAATPSSGCTVSGRRPDFTLLVALAIVVVLASRRTWSSR